MKQGSEEWLAARRAGLGGSEVSVLYDANPYTTQYVLWAQKTGRVDGERATIHDEPAMYWGSKLEGQVRQGYSDLTGRVVRDGVTMLQHPNAPLFANTDGALDPVPEHDGPGVYEGKIAGGVARRDWERDRRIVIPLHYQCQGQVYLECTGCTWGSLAVLFGDRWDLRAIDFEIDRPFIANMLDRALLWWTKHVVLDEPPPIDSSKKTEAALRRVYPDDNGRIVLLPDQFAPLLDWLERSEELVKTAKQEVQRLRNLVIAALGSASFGQLYDGRGFSLVGEDGSRKLRKHGEASMTRARRFAKGPIEPASVPADVQRQAEQLANAIWGIAAPQVESIEPE